MSKTLPNDIFQFSLLSAHESGIRDGGPPVGFLTSHGTHGIGVFEDDDADMIQLDSVTYQFDEDGEATRADKEDQLPFCMVTIFQPSQRVKPPKGTTSKKLKEVFGRSKNTPMPFKLGGQFGYISTKQQTYWDVKGTIFGFSVPSWQKDISGEGLQCCFLTEDKQRGGRVTDFESGEGVTLEWAKAGRLHLGFPQDEEFEQVRLRRNSTA
jgi:alpha-acetolactate decarboxylase